MIKQVTLKNFQVHKEKTFNLTEGLNVIYGDNNQGKSALQRAIFWNFTNKPLGEWMRPRKGKELLESVCEVEFADGFTSKRIRGIENKYIINGQEFTELGSEIPQVLAEYLGDLTLRLGAKKFYPNFLLPDDTMFMIRESSIIKGSLINYFTGFALIEKIKKTITKDARDNKGVIKGKKSSLSLVTEELTKFDQLNEWSSENEKIQAYSHKVKTISLKNKMCVSYLTIGKTVNKLKNVVSLLSTKIDIIQKQSEDIEQKKAQQKLVVHKIDEYCSASCGYDRMKKNNVTEKQLKAVTDSVNQLETHQQRLTGLHLTIKEYYMLKGVIADLRNKITAMKKAKKAFPKTCDKCGSIL